MRITSVNEHLPRFTATPGSEPVVMASPPALNKSDSSGRGSWRDIVASILLSSPTCTRCVLRLVVLIWPLLLGQAFGASGLAGAIWQGLPA